MAKNLSLEISTKNLGPHVALGSKLQMSNLKIGIFASNGSGKTFLSRAFRLVGSKETSKEDSNRLLTIGENFGAFKIKITNTQEQGVIRELEINFERDRAPVILNNSCEYHFRVFNDEYIKENLEELKYTPSGQIEGYILGKEKIDITKEKEELSQLSAQLEKAEKELNGKVDLAIDELDQLSIRHNTLEYQNFTYSNLFNKEHIVEEHESFEKLVDRHNDLKSLPDNLKDLTNLEPIRVTGTPSKIKEFLLESFSKSDIDEAFKQKIRGKQAFIETGILLVDPPENKCPFCEQELSLSALELIDRYNEYLNQAEAIQLKKASDLYSQLVSEKKDYSKLYSNFLKLNLEFSKLKKFIPSLSDSNLQELIDIRTLDHEYAIVEQALTSKKENVSSVISNSSIDDAIYELNKLILNANEIIKYNDKLINAANSIKNDVSSERLMLNKRLCKARYKELEGAEEKLIKEVQDLRVKCRDLQDEIRFKEEREKISRREKVISTFKELLNKFFNKKYSFDEDRFCLKFQNHLLESNASDVLSSGEKSVVAFCYFIAECHRFIDREDDYSNLFFVIDDPVSSQDFHYVYATSQIIRTLDKTFGINRLRVILLTHNLEFMSIIIRNKIIEQKFVLSNSEIKSLGNELIMPYEEHLRDIYEVAKGRSIPTHTTPNSLRHVLETIRGFMSPDVDLLHFCEAMEGYSNSEFLYSLMHDASHGGIRVQKAYTEEMVKSACEVVIKYVTKAFEGQLKKIENQSS